MKGKLIWAEDRYESSFQPQAAAPTDKTLEEDSEEDIEEENVDLVTVDELTKMRSLRNTTLGGVKRLYEASREQRTVGEFAVLWLRFFEEEGLEERVREQQKRLETDNFPEEAEFEAKSWNNTLALLAEFREVPEQAKIPLADFLYYLEEALDQSSSRRIPATGNQVIVGSLAGLAQEQTDYLFIMGATKSSLPGKSFQTSLLSYNDGLRVHGYAVREVLPDNDEQHIYANQSHLYAVLRLPLGQVYLSFTGAAERQAEVMTDLLAESHGTLTYHAKPYSLRDPLLAEASRAWSYLQLLEEQKITYRHSAQDEEDIEALHAWLAEAREKVLQTWQEEAGRKISSTGKLWLPPDLVKELVGDTKVWSISILERYSACPFAYYANHLLKLETRDEWTPDAASYGTLIHAAMEEQQRDWQKQLATSDEPVAAVWQDFLVGLSEEQILDYFQKARERDPSLGLFWELGTAYSTRHKAARAALAGSLASVREYQQNENAWLPRYEEWAFGPETGNPFTVTEAGRTLTFRGRIDRVDLAPASDGQTLVRLVDYKSGQKRVSYEDLYEGLDLQLPVYLQAFETLSGGEAAACEAAYAPVSPTMPFSETKPLDLMTANEKIVKGLSFSSLGLEADLLHKLMKKSLSRANELVTRMEKGDFSAAPRASKPTKTPCRFCEYRSLCGLDRGQIRLAQTPSLEQRARSLAPKGQLPEAPDKRNAQKFYLDFVLNQEEKEARVSLDQVLVLTFTNSSSEDMAGKITKRIKQHLAEAEEAGDEARAALLSRQMTLMPAAHISTIHSFCLWLIRNFSHEAEGADGEAPEADFGTVDPEGQEQLLEEALASVLDQAYLEAETAPSDDTEIFMRLVDNYSGAKNDRRLRTLIRSLHGNLRSLPDYREVVVPERLANLRKACEDFEQSPHFRYLCQGLRLRLNHALAGVRELRQLLLQPDLQFVKDRRKHEGYLAEQLRNLELIEAMDQALKAWEETGATGLWDLIFGFAQDLVWEGPRRGSKPADLVKNEFLDLRQAHLSDLFYYVDKGPESGKANCRFTPQHVWTMPSAEIREGLTFTYPLVEKLFALVLATDLEYTRMKRQRNLVDFNDYEHFALTILRKDAGRAFCQSRFLEVYIDEYQDTSGIQEAILQEVCRDRLFMVGDVKQSIYRFRHARPETFLAKKERFEAGEEGRYYDLNRNFRSEAGILQAINEVFQRVMTRDFSGIDYRKDHAMEPDPGRSPERNRLSGRVEFWIQQTRKELTPEETALYEAEASTLLNELSPYFSERVVRRWLDAGIDVKQYFLIGREILRLHREEQVPFHDVAVMARANHACDEATLVFEEMGIKTNRSRSEGVKSNYILQQQYALLRVLDNASQDIPLASLLLSELLSIPFTEGELAEIRYEQRKQKQRGSFYQALVLTAGGAGALAEKAALFLKELDVWRTRKSHVSVRELLEEIWYKADYQAKLLRDEGQAAVLILEDFALEIEAIEAGGRDSLYKVVRYLEENLKADRTETGEVDFSGDGVNILTFHKSKGLEFPYVFLVNLQSNLRDKDSRDNVVMSEELGIGFDVATAEALYTYPSLLKLAMNAEKKRRYLTEEICLLYVAMSRAETKLYLSGSLPLVSEDEEKLPGKLASLMQQAALHKTADLPDWLLEEISSYQDMIFLGLSGHPAPEVQAFLGEMGLLPAEGASAAKAAGEASYALGEELAWTFKAYPAERSFYDALRETLREQLPEEAPEASALSASEAAGEGSTEEGRGLITMPLAPFYRFNMNAYRTLPKQTVSEIKRRSQVGGAYEAEEETADVNRQIRRLDDLLDEEGRGTFRANERGTIIHTVLRFLSIAPLRELTPLEAMDEVERQLAVMQENKLLSRRGYEEIKKKTSFLAYAQSALAGEVLEAGRLEQEGQTPKIYREMPFTFRYVEEGKASLVQGIIDLWYEGPEGFVLVDYKSDRLPADQASARKTLLERYAVQLRIYALALESTLGQRVSRISIWAFRQAREYRFTREELGLM